MTMKITNEIFSLELFKNARYALGRLLLSKESIFLRTVIKLC